MAFPESEQYNFVDRYVGVVIAQIAATLVFYIILKMLHYVIWGYLYAGKGGAYVEEKQQADVDQRRWDQQSWDVSFPIIFANHVIACAMPLLYMPSVFVCVIAFVHFGLFCALIVVNVFIRDLQPGNGTRTHASRIIWGLMCCMNIILFICGLARIRSVIA